MKSEVVASFWTHYAKLPEHIKRSARKAFRLWMDNPFHPSLHFKCINDEENVWSLRVTRAYRALGVLEGDTVTWFWIGDHAAYEGFFGS